MIRGILSTLLLSSITTTVVPETTIAEMLRDRPQCLRWTWSGDVYNRTVWCLEWSKPPLNDTNKKDQKKNA